MSFPFSKQLLLGAGAFVLVSASIAFAVYSAPRAIPDPAAFLPAEETSAFFAHITKENAGSFATNFPLLNQVPLADSESTVAFLKMTDGQTAWVMLSPSGDDKKPFHIRTSLPAATVLLAKIEKPLSRNYTFTALRADTISNDPWAFVRFPTITLDSASKLAGLIHPDRPVGIAMDETGLTVRFLATNSDEYFLSLANGPQDIFAHPLFILHATNIARLIQMTQSILQPAPALVTESTLRQVISDLFGTSISPFYDLLPLLKGPTSIQTALDPTTHHLRVLLEGTLPQKADIITQLGDAFRAHIGAITITSQIFDDKFSLPTIRRDPSVLTDTKSTASGWTVRMIRQAGNGHGLWTGVRGRQYILSNDAAAVKKAITTTAPMIESLDHVPFGLGILQSKELSDTLNQTIPTVWPRTTLPSGTGGYLKWKMTQEGDRMTIVLKKV